MRSLRTSSGLTELKAVELANREGTSTCASQYVSTYACHVGLYIGTVWADVGFKKYLTKILRCLSVCRTSTRVHWQGVIHLTLIRDSGSLVSLSLCIRRHAYDTRPPDTVVFNKWYLSVTCEQRLKKDPMGKKVSLCSHGKKGQLFCCKYRSKNATVSRAPQGQCEGDVSFIEVKRSY